VPRGLTNWHGPAGSRPSILRTRAGLALYEAMGPVLDTVMRGIMIAASIEDSLSSALGWPPLRRLSVGCSSHKSPQAGFGSAQTGAKPGPSVSLSRRWSDATARIGRYRSGRRTLLQLEAGSNPPIKTDLGAAPRVSAQIGSCSEKFRTPLDALDELRVPEKNWAALSDHCRHCHRCPV
jgi:hypothetical protein